MQDTRGELDAVLERGIESVDDRRLVVSLPVSLVDLLADLAPHIGRAPLPNLDPIFKMLQRRHLQVLR